MTSAPRHQLSASLTASIYAYLVQVARDGTVSSTQDELAAGLGTSQTAISIGIARLEKAGLVTIERGRRSTCYNLVALVASK